ncbi:hypothetical protein O6H91_Y363500 [Diphasiastrum complanatum]|nr:hypothetical protein O6H91_Y363500 [Diphasiastrum complanatum]
MEVIPLMNLHALWKFQPLLSLSLLLLIGDGIFKTVSASGVNNTSLSSILTDTKALLDFKHSVQYDPQTFLNGWVADISKTSGGNDTAVCGWRGVRCTYSRVSALNLSGALLSGPLPEPALSKLDHLQALSLGGNRFHGSLLMGSGTQTPPGENFTDSKSQVRNNSFGQADCKMLTSLDLSWNNFSGEVPAVLGHCNSLKFINLSGNRFSGLIPESLGNLRSLRSLNFSHNNLSGVIPPELTMSCATLQEIDLSNNNLSGSIPMQFSACTSLEHFCLSHNNFSGRFPDILGQMHSLQILKIDDNYIEGPLPSHVDNCTDLEVLDLSSNFFSEGSPAQEFCGVNSALKILILANNRFTGPVSSSLTNCTHLQILDLSFNFFTGKFPPELCTSLDLEHLMIWYNRLEGMISPDIGSCKKLKTLVMNYNNLQGFIPPQLSNCSELRWLSLSNNQFSGPIPPELGLLQNLIILQLSNNSLTGDIPLELGNCSTLVWLDLNSNYLNGVIPPRIGRKVIAPLMHGAITNVLGFARNVDDKCKGVGGLLEIEGIRWQQLSQLPMLLSCKYRFYRGVNLSADTKVSSLVYLDLSYNDLSGTLPAEIGTMTDLVILDVSHNSLNGSIPPSIGRLNNLELLHLAWNQLQGEIPSSFSNLTFLVDFNLSHSNLSGQIPAGGQLTTFPASAYDVNDGLCGLPIGACSQPPPTHLPAPSRPTAYKKRALPRMARIILVLILILILASLIGIVLWWVWHQKKLKKECTPTADSIFAFDQNWKTAYKEPLSINVATFERPLRRITFTDLVEATKGFDVKNMVGSGGFGEVYKAHLMDGSIVAVKKLTRFNYQGERQFVSEMETLGKIKHPNLVPLLGYCKIGEERILVYEYMPGGNLEHLLYETHLGGARINILWELRKQIALDMARGLAFLHHQCIPHVIHRDMKSSNVLLDICYEARLSDFGMARLISASDTHNSVSSLAGTPGYVPPEYYQSCRCTKEGDVYSFGVVLLEILTRRKPTDKEEFGENNLVGWVKLHVNENRSIEVLDPDLIEQNQEQEEMLQYLSVACKCLEDQQSRRPSMLQVVAIFKELSLDSDTDCKKQVLL